MSAVFYEQLANRPEWRQRCGYCNCPKWAHARVNGTDSEYNIILADCGCGDCSHFRMKSRLTKPDNRDILPDRGVAAASNARDN